VIGDPKVHFGALGSLPKESMPETVKSSSLSNIFTSAGRFSLSKRTVTWCGSLGRCLLPVSHEVHQHLVL
jgi:hypothetical protein